MTTAEPHPAGSPEAVADVVLAMAPPLAMALAEHPEQAAAVHAAVVDALQPSVTDDGVILPGAGWAVSAQPERSDGMPHRPGGGGVDWSP